jgi:hypothetical protein
LIAIDSQSLKPSSSIAGTRPLGLIDRNQGERLAAADADRHVLVGNAELASHPQHAKGPGTRLSVNLQHGPCASWGSRRVAL